MLSLSVNSVGRTKSSLELMLDSLLKSDVDSDKPKDIPPALPARPKLTPRARLPSLKKRPLPLPSPSPFEKLDNGGTDLGGNFSSEVEKIEVKEEIRKDQSFGAKRFREMEPTESPYLEEEVEENEFEKRKFMESEWDDYIDYFIKKKLRVWCRSTDKHWEIGKIQLIEGRKASVLLDDGNVVSIQLGDLLPANPEILEGVDDLIQLSYSNEPSVLHNLQHRFSCDIIYSKAGPVLMAINPLKDVQLYGNEYATLYRQNLVDSPHVYVAAESAYTAMMRDELNQSIVIRGESGSGKTETAKAAMEYLAAISGGSSGITYEVLQTNCILEAFGNAKTSRNDNSSRFGKWIILHFTENGIMCGAKIETFLLEKLRVVQLANGERSYHVFYQLCAGAPFDLKERLKLKKASDFKYLNRSDCFGIHNVDDTVKFHLLTKALDTLRICKEDQENVFEMLAAVLWLGNISFEVIDNENHAEVVHDEAVTIACNLIGCTALELMQALSTRKIQVDKDMVAERLTLQEALDARDTLAKFIYSTMFDWLVKEVNNALAVGKGYTGRSICILDMYGFESSKESILDQFYINYANERLQQHFHGHLLKLDQEEYESDDIDWTKVEFEDSQDCLNLFDKLQRPIGLISTSDKESSFPEASGLNLTSRLQQHFDGSLSKGERDETFSACHSAGKVLYDTSDLLEKNRDAIKLLSSCSKHLPQVFASSVQHLAVQHLAEKSPVPLVHSGVLDQTQSVVTKFKGQAFKFMQHLENTAPHFICCIKPNNKLLPGIFESDVVLKQLRCFQLLEVVRIARSGYPTRMTHQEFANRYGFLLLENNATQDPLNTSVAILQQLGIRPEMYRAGYKHIFLRAGQVGVLEDTRKQVQLGNLELQNRFHNRRACHNFHELRESVITLQSFVRGEIAKGQLNILRQSKYEKQSRAVVQIQSVIHGWLARKNFRELRDSRIVNSEERKQVTLAHLMGLDQENRPSSVDELKKRVLLVGAELRKEEDENDALREQTQQLESRWLESEVNSKSIQGTWQKKIASLQMSLAAARGNLGADQMAIQAENSELSPSPCYDSEEMMSGGARTPAESTPAKLANNGIENISGLETNGGLTSVSSPHANGFENSKRRSFEDDAARSISQVKSETLHPGEEYRSLKQKFEAWKKEYKIRLKELKVKLQKLGRSEGDKGRMKWWGGRKKSKKV